MANDESKKPTGPGRVATALRALELGDVAVWDWNLTTGQISSRGPWDRLLGPLPPAGDDRLEWFMRAVHPEDRNRLTVLAETASARGKIDVTFRLVRPDGETRWLTARGGYSERGASEHYLSGVMLDVTDEKSERSTLHRALSRSEQLLRSVIATAPVILQTVDREGRILTSNRSVIGESLFRWTSPETRVPLRELLDRVFDEKATGTIEGEVEGVGYFSGHYAPIVEDDEVVAAAAVISDMTEQQRQSSQMRDSEARFREMAESSPLAIWRAGRDMSCTYVNSEFLRFSGRDASQMLGQRWADLMHPDDRERGYGVWAGAFARREPFSFEAQFRRADGQYRLMLATGRPILTEKADEFGGYVGTCVDLTDIRRAQEASELHRTELANALRLATMDQMTAGLAHELHQPLAAISAATGAALRELSGGRRDSARVTEMVDEARQQALRAGTLLGHMRDFIRKEPNVTEELSLNELVSPVVELVRREALRLGITLDVALADELPPTTGHRIELQQVLINLAQNGFRAMHGAEEEQRVLRIETSYAAGDWVCVTVSDRGHGFTPEVAREMFDVFFTTRPDGLGMGLAISRSIVEAHGGTLTAAPGAEGGATFRMLLPVRKVSNIGS